MRELELFTQYINISQKTLDILLTQYESGSSEFKDILDLQMQVLTYKLKLENALVRQNVAFAELMNLYNSN